MVMTRNSISTRKSWASPKTSVTCFQNELYKYLLEMKEEKQNLQAADAVFCRIDYSNIY